MISQEGSDTLCNTSSHIAPFLEKEAKMCDKFVLFILIVLDPSYIQPQTL